MACKGCSTRPVRRKHDGRGHRRLGVNLVVAFWLRHFAASDMNVRSAFYHVIGDAAASVGVIRGAIVMYFTDWYPQTRF